MTTTNVKVVANYLHFSSQHWHPLGEKADCCTRRNDATRNRFEFKETPAVRRLITINNFSELAKALRGTQVPRTTNFGAS